MNIIKKDGRVQEFTKDKLKTSINNSAKDANFSLTESDLNLLVSDMYNKLVSIRKDGNTSSYEVMGVVIHVLKENKFNQIICAYIS